MKKPQFVLLEGRKDDEYSYEDVLVSLHRLAASTRAQNAARKLGYQVKNTAKELDGTPYIGDINHQKANSLVTALRGKALNISQSIDLFDDLQNKKTLYDENGKPLPRKARDALYNEMVGEKDPWRSEWLADLFIEINDNLYRANDYVLNKGVLVPKHFERITKDQIKRLEVRAKEHFSAFYYPVNGSVARFGADSGWAGIDCNGNPGNHGASLGVRFVREKN